MISDPLKRTARIRMVALGGILGSIALLHEALWGVAAGLLHGILGHLYLVPIIISAYWFGIKGAVTVSILSVALFSPHLLRHWHDPFIDVYNYVEIFLFLLIGATTGLMSQMERNRREQYEQALVRLDESHRKLKEQTEILFQTEEQLRRADRLSALGELSAGMAHEIRNPLGSIKGAAEILGEDYRPGAPKEEFVQILLKETDRLDRIVREFLSFARPKTPDLQPFRANEIIESVLTLTAQAARKAGVTVEKRLDPALGPQSLDADLLKQAFLNLVLNALQAMHGGGTLTVASRYSGGCLEVEIADTGVGIAPEHRKKLFSPFFTTRRDGTGLGLAITYRIVQNHGGTIDVASEPGKGTTFTIRIPFR